MKTFHLGDILSVTTEKLVAPGGIAAVHELLDYMVGEPLWTHQLPRANDECKPELLRQHPFLVEVTAPDFADEAHVWRWLGEQVDRWGESFEVAPLRPGNHTSIDPLTEFRMMRPDMPVLPVVLDGAS